MTITYDALNRIVEQGNGATFTQTVYSPLGAKFALMNGQALVKAFAPLPDGAIAAYTSSGLAYYRHPDWLGSSRLASTPNRTIYSDVAYAPFGEAYSQTGSTDLSFTGQNQDVISGLYDFLFREESPTQGRWISPDPSGLGAVDVTDPQSWNRYAYVRNRPLLFTDTLGLFECQKDDGKGGLTIFQTPDDLGLQGCLDAGGTPVIIGGGSPGGNDGGNDGNNVGDGPCADPGLCGNAPGAPGASSGNFAGGGGGPNNANQPSWQQKMRQVTHFICGKSPGDRVVKSVLTGAGIGAITWGIGGFVAGEVFGG